MRINQNINRTDKFKNSAKAETTSKSGDKSASVPEKGSRVQGTISDIKSGQVKILLDNNQTLDAKLTTDHHFHIGQSVTFQVKESSDEQVLLTPVSEGDDAVDGQILRILDQLDMKTSDKNVQVLKALVGEGMAVNKDMVHLVQRTMLKFPETPIKDILFMIKNDIPITPSNVSNMAQFTEAKPVILEQLGNTISEVASRLLVPSGETGTTNELSQMLGMDKSEQQTVQGLNQLMTSLSETASTQAPTNTEVESGRPISQEVNVTQQTVDGSILNEPTSSESQKPGLTPEQLPQVSNEPLPEQVATKLNTSLNQVVKSLGFELPNNIEVKSLEELNTVLKELSLNTKQLEVIKDQVIKPVVSQMVERHMLLSFESLKTPDSVKEYFNQLNEQMHKISERFGSEEGIGIMGKEAESVKEGLDFIKSVNQNYQFLELPMMINDQVLKGNLYVFGKSKARLSKQEAVSAMIQLDMLNLGHLDVYVNKDKQAIDIQFFTESDDKKQIVASSINNLYKAVSDLGYHVNNMSVTVREESFDVREEFMDADKVEIKHVAFDMRV